MRKPVVNRTLCLDLWWSSVFHIRVTFLRFSEDERRDVAFDGGSGCHISWSCGPSLQYLALQWSCSGLSRDYHTNFIFIQPGNPTTGSINIVMVFKMPFTDCNQILLDLRTDRGALH